MKLISRALAEKIELIADEKGIELVESKQIYGSDTPDSQPISAWDVEELSSMMNRLPNHMYERYVTVRMLWELMGIKTTAEQLGSMLFTGLCQR